MGQRIRSISLIPRGRLEERAGFCYVVRGDVTRAGAVRCTVE